MFDRSTVSTMSATELVAAYNELRPNKPVKRFASHADGVRRVIAALGEQPAEAPAAKPSPKGKRAAAAPAVESVVEEVEEAGPAVAQAKAAPATADAPPAVEKAPRKLNAYTYAAAAGVAQREPTKGKRAAFFARLRSPEGISYDEAQADFGWKRNDVGDVVAQLAKFSGWTIARNEDGRFRIVG